MKAQRSMTIEWPGGLVHSRSPVPSCLPDTVASTSEQARRQMRENHSHYDTMTKASTDALSNRVEGVKRVLRRLIDKLHGEGLEVRKWGVETAEYETEFGAAEDEMVGAFASLDVTRLDVFKGTDKIGWFLLVRGNSPIELIANYTKFDGAEAIYRDVIAGESR